MENQKCTKRRSENEEYIAAIILRLKKMGIRELKLALDFISALQK